MMLKAVLSGIGSESKKEAGSLCCAKHCTVMLG